MEGFLETLTFKEMVTMYYSEVVKTMGPDKIAEWVQTLEKIKTAYPTLWNSPFVAIEQLTELCPEESRMILRLFPSLAIDVAEYVYERSEEEIEAEGKEIAAAAMQVLYKLFLVAYVAGHIDGQRESAVHIPS